MNNKIFDNNQVTINGEIVSGFTFSHDVFGEGFYLFDLRVNRLSDTVDIIPVMVSERIIDVEQDLTGNYAVINGQFRSFNRHEEEKTRLVLSVFAREIEILEEPAGEVRPNYIFLDGFVCKPPIYRKTPLGREIADVLLAVNRPYGKSDYIPCLLWGRNAIFADGFQVGDHIRIWGRIQSRKYQKRIDEGIFEERTAYEVSVNKVELVEEVSNAKESN